MGGGRGRVRKRGGKEDEEKVNVHVLVQCNKMRNLTHRCKSEFLI